MLPSCTVYEGFTTSTQSFMAGKDQELAPKRDGNAAKMVFDRPQLEAFVIIADCHRSNPSKALSSNSRFCGILVQQLNRYIE